MKKFSYIFLLFALLPSILSAQSFGDRLDLDPGLAPFYHGVASGDPLSDAVIIWTRITTDLNTVDGIWRIATDSLFTENVQQGSFSTSSERDYTVKVDVTGLSSNTYYFFDFQAIGARSLIGRTKTAPSGSTDQYRIVFVSCADMSIGYFNVYERIMERNDFDVVYHLGDYIYEYPDDRYLEAGLKVRDVEPDHETITLTDYRTRYSFYRLDPKLRGLHQQYPFVTTWDDHEFANDAHKDGASNHSSMTEGLWSDRKAAAAKAFLEWMPIRVQAESYDIERSFGAGNLAEFFVIESRVKHRSIADTYATLFPELDNSTRGIIGHDQRNWLEDGLLNTSAQWKIMVSPVVFAPLYRSTILRSGDGWDGYPWERKQIVNHVVENDIKNFIVISGDVHSSFSFDLPYKIDQVRNTNHYNPNTGEGSMGVNFVGAAVCAGLCCRNTTEATWQSNNPHLKYANLKQNGYALLDVKSEKVTCDYYYVDTVHINEDVSHWWEASWCVLDSIPHLQNCGQPSEFNGVQYPFAPTSVGSLATSSEAIHLGEILGTYPIPARDFVGIQFFLQSANEVFIDLFDLSGKLLQSKPIGSLERGVHFQNIRLNRLNSGEFIMNIRNEEGNTIASRKLIKL